MRLPLTAARSNCYCPRMNYSQLHKHLCFSLILSLLAFSATASLFAQTPLTAIQPQQFVLIKKSDRVIQGQVRLVGNLYEIQLSDQARVSIARDQVAFVGASMKDVYNFKVTSVTRWAVGDHFQVTRWCLLNGMLPEATHHYLEVYKQSPNHPSVNQLGVELEQRVLADNKFRQYIGLPPVSTAAGLASKTTTGEAEKNPGSGVVLASTDLLNATASPQIGLRFNERVQPILINRCSQSACHGVNSSNAFRLIEPLGKSYARIAADNLKSSIAQLQRDNHGVAELVRYATTAHGLQRAPGIAVTEPALINELNQWIQFVENPVVSAVAGADFNSLRPVQNVASAALTRVAPGAQPLSNAPNAPSDFPAGDAVPTAREIDALEAELDRLIGPAQNSADPFDPAVFNRQVTGGR